MQKNETNNFWDSFRRQKTSRKEANSKGFRALSHKPSEVAGIVLNNILRPLSEIAISELKPLAVRGGCFL